MIELKNEIESKARAVLEKEKIEISDADFSKWSDNALKNLKEILERTKWKAGDFEITAFHDGALIASTKNVPVLFTFTRKKD